MLLEKNEVLAYCLSLPQTYEDYPFHDERWAVMRCLGNKKSFALLYEREGHLWVNVKCDPQWRDFWRNAYESVIPGFHMNKEHWNTIILDGTVPDKEIKRMIAESYDLVKPKPGKRARGGNVKIM